MSDYSSESGSEQYYDSDGDEENYGSGSESGGRYSEDTDDMYMDESTSGSSSSPESSDDEGPSGLSFFASSDSTGGLSRLFASGDSVGKAGADDDDDDEKEDEVEEAHVVPFLGFREYISFCNVEEVICLNCFDVPRDPVTLPCGHVICRECAKEAAEVFKASSCFTQRYNVKDEEVKEGDVVVMCPVCMKSVVLKGGIGECKSDTHTEEVLKLYGREERPLCSMCLSERSAGVDCQVEKGIYECEKCGPLCEKHSHSLTARHDHEKYRCDDKSHMRFVVYPVKKTRVKTNSKRFDLTHGVSGRVLLDEGHVPCEVYCETCAKPVSRIAYRSRCMKSAHKTISLEAAVEKVRKEREEQRAHDQTVEQEKRKKISETVDSIEDKVTDLCTRRLVSVSLLEDGIYTTHMSDAQTKIRQFYDRLRAACDASEAKMMKDLEERDRTLKEDLARRVKAAEVISTDAQYLASAVKANLEGLDYDEFMEGLLQRLLKMNGEVEEASALDQEARDLTTFVKERRAFTDEELQAGLPSGLFIDTAAVSAASGVGAAENYESEEEAPEEKSSGPLTIEEARKRIKEFTTDEERRSIDSRLTFRSLIGSPLKDLPSSNGQEMFCSAVFEMLMKLRPDFSIEMIPVLTESFCSLHSLEEIKKFEKVSDVFVELKAVALVLGMEL
jgi:hypothetical protein